MAIAKLVKIEFVSGVLRVQDYTNFFTYPHSAQTVAVTLPGATTSVSLSGSQLGYYVVGSNKNPMLIQPETFSGVAVFPDGVYRVQITQISLNNLALNADERLLYIPVIDACILKKTDTYLRSSCDNCKSDSSLKLLQELVIIRQAAQLDINLGQYSAAAAKVILLTNLCTGASCKCICGC
tara:strand:+ start:150 stop:692 length:543 start_codon:yes stop_codon:yes gene_type:complete